MRRYFSGWRACARGSKALETRLTSCALRWTLTPETGQTYCCSCRTPGQISTKPETPHAEVLIDQMIDPVELANAQALVASDDEVARG